MARTQQGTSLSYNGYYRNQTAEPDLYLCGVLRGTPGGEYHRRFWQPVCYERELTDVPLKVRALGEDLVVFKDLSGRIGCLHLQCCHRNSSLEYGMLTKAGIMCCYHGRVFDVSGRVVDMPGEPQAERFKNEVSQGGYPVHVFGGLVFIYMGPPERIPVFPMLDRFQIPGLRLVPGERLPLDCNWLQIKENSVDPHHTNILHVIPQMRGMAHFAEEFAAYPELTWAETPAGVIYLGVRKVGSNIWVRSAETFGPTIHQISSIFESGQTPKRASRPFLTFWTLPVDNEHSLNFFISHVGDDEDMPFEQRRSLEMLGQYEDRPYHDRQLIPGDHDAQVSQGPINVHRMEHLGTQDRGIVMYRRFIRRGIQTVEKGEDPKAFFLAQADVPPTFANDRVTPISELSIDVNDPAALRSFGDQTAKDYFAHPPMRYLLDETEFLKERATP
ncbi:MULTISPECIES: Rieske 2Fe-2S domain-containing protein [unclassified Beijerinckia]|uniref:Rieske 2Fe-2S domain-containing protein n=1 Tax=unclassified Beijerinckia TaxID=2638183 RepID=UPI00089ABEAF|nr:MULTISPECIES: Rieske 2Fe-2S domain-containing protein [unclassified Beijerinckia]MDH7798977.1 phenylpropionate dioxygenase-like ring-hydroxylating dioxygenase large terminal subunit [Beijerinckia sp. GAS462]SED85399.1 Rieske [2Fe-2S] domain-containing protein [Beijerinckia sp. 28-YEA-48]